MSKASVGDVYAKVIKEVCEQSQVDFEEGGVDQATLELLMSEWKRKLSQLKVTGLPWDPVPSSAAQNASSSSNDRKPPSAYPVPGSSNGNALSTPTPPNFSAGPRVKQETGAYPTQPNAGNGYPLPVPKHPQDSANTARQRAAHNLQQRFAGQAAAQINQLQQGHQQRAPVTQSVPQSVPFIKPDPDAKPAQDYKPPPQTDGGGDAMEAWKTEVVRRRELARRDPNPEDRLFRNQFLDSQQRLEGGGLMLPLGNRYMPSQATKRKVHELKSNSRSPMPAAGLPTSSSQPSSSLAHAQGDAAADDEDSLEVDEDAINSDLDDPNEPGGEENNEENTDQVMLCTYDKVQRVKNKWKCTLKDGILRVDGSEYVFHKGQGEFEW